MNVAFIPVRGGSKSIPLKNIKILNGKPLVYWVTRAAVYCDQIDKVFISTDSDLIRETVISFCEEDGEPFSKVSVISRSEETASDTASTESAMLEFANNFDFDNIVLIQATSPLLSENDLNNGFEAYYSPKTDSVLSVVKQKRFNWVKEKDGFSTPLNYDFYKRPRRQDFEGYLVENGAFYITSKRNLLSSKNRISGRIKTVEMCEESFFEIDEPSDWIIIESLMKQNHKSVNPPHVIKAFLSDCDGCLTDGGMYYSEFGDELKKFNTKDGVGFSRLKEADILTGIVTGENVELNKRRAEKMQLDIYKYNCKDKLQTINEICTQYSLQPENICYIGDDLNDLEVLKHVGFSCCPANASPEVKAAVDYIAINNGGQGVIREIADLIIANQTR